METWFWKGSGLKVYVSVESLGFWGFGVRKEVSEVMCLEVKGSGLHE